MTNFKTIADGEIFSAFYEVKKSISAAQFGDLKTWRKKGQRAELNNKIILDCVKEVYHDKF